MVRDSDDGDGVDANAGGEVVVAEYAGIPDDVGGRVNTYACQQHSYNMGRQLTLLSEQLYLVISIGLFADHVVSV